MTTFYVEPFVLPYIPTDFEDMDWSIPNLNAEEEGQAKPGVPNETPASTPAFDFSSLKAYEICEILRRENHFANKGGRVYAYKEGVYKWADDSLRTQLYNRIGPSWSPNKVNSVLQGLLDSSPQIPDVFDINLINCKNGIVDLTTGELKPHDPDLLTLVQIPHNWNPDATCPRIDQFISEVFPTDNTLIAYEIAGYVCSTDTSMQKAILFYGDGNNGKSVMLRLIERLIGEGNYSAVALQKIENFRLADSIYGKLANICGDISPKSVENTDTFKKLTGGDSVTADYKHGHAFTFRPFSTLIFSCNEYFRSIDHSEGFKRRWLHVPFNATIENPDPYLGEKLHTESELEGFLYKSLLALRDVQTAQGFTESVSTDEAKRNFADAIDVVSTFLNSGEVIFDSTMRVRKSQLFAKYVQWCEADNRGVQGKQKFNRSVAKHPNIVHKLDDGYEVWQGIGLPQDYHS